jgi:hypothetical protein
MMLANTIRLFCIFMSFSCHSERKPKRPRDTLRNSQNKPLVREARHSLGSRVKLRQAGGILNWHFFQSTCDTSWSAI